jgi:glycosyltransferase involved in cell wall biosynthesis
VRETDNRILPKARHIFTIAGNVARRLDRYNGIKGQVLYPPPKLDGRYREDGYGDYLFAVSRLDPLKRLDLVIRAMQYTRSQARCLIAGTGAYGERLRALAEELGVTGKVSFLGYVSDERLIELYAGCFAVFFAPYDEDYGFITVEAFKSRKPVVTTSDSGAVLEFVEDGRSGYVVGKGDVKSMAARIDYLFENRAICKLLGAAGYERVKEINWERTIATLMAEY